MSASLVGSEMCIRDRLPPNRTLWQELATSPPAPTRAGRRPSAPNGPCETCLLYTSDAADDM
eukprot:10959774-Alexandrium_andersonii.AAC.1